MDILDFSALSAGKGAAFAALLLYGMSGRSFVTLLRKTTNGIRKSPLAALHGESLLRGIKP